ncbi:MAG: hypothetical protein GDA38_20795 [Hormoscilla sp. SP12CHS1]|nr:hypothetical protein [Hormoscilla sp. SP12CHS1]
MKLLIIIPGKLPPGPRSSPTCPGSLLFIAYLIARAVYLRLAKVYDYILYNRSFRTLSGHSNNINSVEIAPDGKTLVSGSRDNNIKLWDRPG